MSGHLPFILRHPLFWTVCIALTAIYSSFIPVRAWAMSVDKEGKGPAWSATWNAPAVYEVSVNNGNRRYAFKGTGQAVLSSETQAGPIRYFDYTIEGSYDVDSKTAKESIEVTGTDPVFNPPLEFKGTYTCSADPWLNRNAQCNTVSQSRSIPSSWFVPPMRNKILTDQQIEFLRNKVISEAKKLVIIEPRLNASCKAKNAVPFMIRQYPPPDLTVVPAQKIRLQIEHTEGEEQNIIRDLSASGSGSYWGTSIDMKPGKWRARAYSIQPEFQHPDEAVWRTFTVTASEALAEPPLQPAITIVSPGNGKSFLHGNPVQIKLDIAQHLVKPGSSAEVFVSKIHATAPGSWPKPPTSVYTKSWPVSGISTTKSIPASALTETGKYRLEAVFYPDGKTGSSYTSHKAASTFTINKLQNKLQLKPGFQKPGFNFQNK